MKKTSSIDLYDPEDRSPIIAFGATVFNLMMLNVMWFICSLLVVTMGAATTALNYTCIKMRRDEDTSIVRLFFGSFFRNIRQALVLWTGLLIVLIVLITGLVQLVPLEGSMYSVLRGALLLIIVLWAIVFTYVFMVLSRFDNTIFNTVRNAVFLSITHFKETMQLLLIDVLLMVALPYASFMLAPALLPIFIFIGVPTVAYFNAGIFNKKIFNAYVPDSTEEE